MLTDNLFFDICFNIAYKSHIDQVDKSNQSYLLHCIRVVNILQEEFGVTDLKVLALGLVHDSLEDSLFVTADDVLELTMDKEFVDDLKLLTRNKNENYFDYIRRVKSSDRAKLVKLADIEDHINLKCHINDSLLDRYFKAKSILHGIDE